MSVKRMGNGGRRQEDEEAKRSASNALLGNSEAGGNRNGMPKSKSVRGSSWQSLEVTEEEVEIEKAALLAEKHVQLESLLDKHDTLVREIFHMDHFLVMLGYKPTEAKQENSKVFQEYKTKLYDLVDKAVPGPSRTTRSARTERKQFLTKPSASKSQAPLATNRTKIKTKTTTAIWERLGTNGKGKEKEIDNSNMLTNSQNLDTTDDTRENEEKDPDLQDSISVMVSRRNRHKKGRDTELNGTVSASGQKRGKEKLPAMRMAEPMSIPNRRSGRLNAPVTETNPPADTMIAKTLLHENILPEKRGFDSVDSLVLPSTPKFNVKRIKLVVRRPPPPLTNPKQRPPPARFNSSLRNFLSSYTTHIDQDINDKSLKRQVEIDAAILERTELFRKQGRFIPGTDVLFGFNVDTTSYTTPQRLNKDHWDIVVDAVVSQARVRSKRPLGQQIASQIASKIQVYWDGQEAKRDKLKIQEERRLRALAKTTIKIVTSEWKKAVFYIREKERLKLEAEEVRRGHEHLDAILDQSGQLLETQHGDLSRGENSFSRSRSGSIPESDSGDDEDEGDEDEGEDEDENEDTRSQSSEADEDDGGDDSDEATEEGDTSRMLLHGDTSYNISHTPGVSPGGPDASNSLHHPTSINSNVPDEDMEPDRSSISAVEELMENSIFGSSPLPSVVARLLMSPGKHEEGDLQPPSPQFSEKTSLSAVDVDDSTYSMLETTSEPPPYSSPRFSTPDYDVSHIDHFSVDQNSSAAVSSPDIASEVVDQNSPASSLKTMTSPGRVTSPSPRDVSLQAPSDPKFGGNTPAAVSPSSEPAEGTSKNGAGASQAMVTDEHDEVTPEPEPEIKPYLKPFAAAPVDWDPSSKITPPLLLRGVLRPYQQLGLEWLASLHTNRTNGILADEMGLGKTIQTIALLAHLACDHGIWGPHLIVVPTSVLLNWEMEFKKFLPGFKVISYHGTTKRRKELRQGWNDKYYFNVCITSYTLASRDARAFKRKAWYYMILDEAHMIKNFKSQRWNILLMFRSFRRLLLTGTPLQNNLTELWALLQFLMSGANFANLKEFGEWFSNPLEKAIEMGNIYDDETMQRVTKLHTVLRPYLLRRLKRDVEKELPSKYEHLVMCPLSKRQRFLYDEFMSRAHTREALQSGVYQKIANILMQLRKVCNHPDLFEVRPIVTSFAMAKSAAAEFEIKELLIRRRLLSVEPECLNLGLLGLQFVHNQNTSIISYLESRRLDATSFLPFISEAPGEPPPIDTRTIAGYRKYSAYLERAHNIARWSHIGYLNRLRCRALPVYSQEVLSIAARFCKPILPISAVNMRSHYWETVQPVNLAVKSYANRADEMAGLIDRFAFVTPAVVALDMPHISLPGCQAPLVDQPLNFDEVIHRASVKLQIAFPDPSLLQYDCGKLQELARLLRDKKAGGHRVLIFTQMTRILDILEVFLNFHGYLYLRLDGATKIEDRQYITERFNSDSRIFCFIASSRSGGVGINLTGADTVIFYDSDFNPQMDRQCEDRAHRIGQIRDVHIYRFVSQHTVEEAMLRKANQKRSLDDLVIQKGEFDWRSLFNDEGALTKALGEFEDTEDAHAAAVAAREEVVMEGADEADFGGDLGDNALVAGDPPNHVDLDPTDAEIQNEDFEEEPEEGGSVVDYMILTVQRDYDYFRDWRL